MLSVVELLSAVQYIFYTLAQTLENLFSISVRSSSHSVNIPLIREYKKNDSYCFFCPIHADLPVNGVITQLDFVGVDPVPTVTKTKKGQKFLLDFYAD